MRVATKRGNKSIIDWELRNEYEINNDDNNIIIKRGVDHMMASRRKEELRMRFVRWKSAVEVWHADRSDYWDTYVYWTLHREKLQAPWQPRLNVYLP